MTREQQLKRALRDALRAFAQVLDDLDHGDVDVDAAAAKIGELQAVLDGN